MAKTSYLQIEAAQEEAYYSALKPGDRFINPRIYPKTSLISQQKIAGLTARSYLPACSVAWQAMTDQQKADWKSADQHLRKHGWRNFVADKCARIKFGIPGNATPTPLHQDYVGKILIEAPAEECEIIQPHPAFYYISSKVPGTKSMYEPVFVEEGFGLPFEIAISYKSNLVSTGAGSFARLTARVRRLYQGQNLDYDLNVEMDLIHDWETKDSTLTSVTGQAISYNLYIHLYKVTGTLLFDNVKAEHSGSNWVRAFYQVPQLWASIMVPIGVVYLSVYPT